VLETLQRHRAPRFGEEVYRIPRDCRFLQDARGAPVVFIGGYRL
jgi:hypothetical protein